jgi:peptidoglycan/xylan/chitin deacetylase (PgdA/CDA1 family)
MSRAPTTRISTVALGLAALLAGCKKPPPPVVVDAAPPPALTADQLDGHAFPDHVLALTWDDGPDVHTKELAEFLAREKVDATFFVIESWDAKLSSDPGTGKGVYQTGYAHLPLLPDLVRLGHRLGNHTRHHVLLTEADTKVALAEVREAQEKLDPLQTNDLHLFRAPGGAWSAETAAILNGDPALRELVGPVRWDIDRKDWENAALCRSSEPQRDCELDPGGTSRVKASITAERYLASIEEAKHGIVLFHDRVGDVGSDYPLQVARIVVPALVEKGYVFAAPVLAFGSMKAHANLMRVAMKPTGPEVAAVPGADRDGVLIGDLNGDGRNDACGRTSAGFACALALPHGFAAPSVWSHDAFSTESAWLADVNGDHRADLCLEQGKSVTCGMAP